MTTLREAAPTYRELITYDQVRNRWVFDPHWLRWLNMLQTQLGALGTTPGHTIENEGTTLPDQPIINFVGAGVTATDSGGKTVVTIPGASSPSTLVLAAELAADISTAADTNPVSLTDLLWDFEPNSIYTFRFIGNVSPAAATTGCGFQLLIT